MIMVYLFSQQEKLDYFSWILSQFNFFARFHF